MLRRIHTGWRAKLALVTGKAVAYATLSAFFLQAASAATPSSGKNGSPYGNEELEIPQSPSAPPSLLQAIPPDPFHCHRKLTYQGKVLDCDTNVRRDGENLRRIIKDVPDAVSELDAYQHTRRNLRYTAYAVSAGLLVTLAGYFSTRGPGGWRYFGTDANDPKNGSLTPMAIVALSGLLFSVGAFSYGFVVYENNESHLNDAVANFNRARPNTPIELEFKTGFHF